MHDNNRVLVVDDSSFMSQLLKVMLVGENFIVEIARDGKEALAKLDSFRPNVITMDIEMPVMSGLQALEIIMEQSPTPVIMVSAQTIRGAQISLRALEMGAFDIVTKPGGEIGQDINSFRRELLTKIKIAMLVPPEKLSKPKQRQILTVSPTNIEPSVFPELPASADHYPVVLIGTSTGGPSALQTVLTQLPKNFPAPILVVQHMPQNFTKLMAERLDSLCELEVKEASDGDRVISGRVLVAPGGMQMGLAYVGSQVVTRITKDSPVPTPFKPSVNVLFKSAAEIYGNRVIALVLTGMGSDGLEGSRALKAKGAYVLAEAEETCIVYGMSKSLVDARLADTVLPLPEIGKFLGQKLFGAVSRASGR